MPDDDLDGLCPHHLLALNDQGWRGHWPHEAREDFINRVADYKRQCCDQGERD